MLVPILVMCGVVCLIYFFFAILGMWLFGGKVRKGMEVLTNNTSGIPDTYHLDNFNDFFSGLVTLFTLMVVNNWYVQVQMFVLVTENPYVRYYFIAFWYMSVIIAINIFVAFAIDMYSSV